MGTTTFVWDPVFDCVTHELDENNNVKAEYHNEPQQYGGVLSQRRGTTSHYHHHDALGSTRFLTDSSGYVTDTYLHDAWGNSVAATGTTVNPFKWVGKYGYYTDDSTGQVYVRARMYLPMTAKWESHDPIGIVIGMTQLSYVSNHPINWIDASGLWQQLGGSDIYWKAGRGDVFQTLVDEVNARFQISINRDANIACIHPLGKGFIDRFYDGGVVASDPDVEDWRQKRPTPCAVYDVSNLIPSRHTSEFSASIGTDKNKYIEFAGKFFGATWYKSDLLLFEAMASASGTGATPLRFVDFVGHSWSNANSIGSFIQGNGNGTLNLRDFDTYQRRFVQGLVDHVGKFKWQSELARAMNWEFSVPCWFAVDSEVTMAGCITNKFAGNLGDTILRNGGAFARGSSKPTWYLRDPLQMGWGNANATAAAANPDFKSKRAEYLQSKNWDLHEGTN